MKINEIDIDSIISASKTEQEVNGRLLIIYGSKLNELIRIHNEREDLEDTYFT